MSKYNILFEKIARLLIPPFLRKQKMLDWLRALLRPIQTLNTRFSNFILEIRYRTRFNGQVLHLERVLNDRFDDLLRRIYIVDGQSLGLPIYIYNRTESRQAYVYNRSEPQNPEFYLRNRLEFFSVVDFVVWVPVSILNADPEAEQRIRATVNTYRIAGRRFSIQGF